MLGCQTFGPRRVQTWQDKACCIQPWGQLRRVSYEGVPEGIPNSRAEFGLTPTRPIQLLQVSLSGPFVSMPRICLYLVHAFLQVITRLIQRSHQIWAMASERPLPYPQLTACAFLVWLPLSGSGFVNMRGSAESTFISRQSQQMAPGLANSMGLFLQKTNIIRDYLEDYAPRSAWLQRVGLKWTRGRWPSFLAPVGAAPGILPARKTMTSDARAAQCKGHH